MALHIDENYMVEQIGIPPFMSNCDISNGAIIVNEFTKPKEFIPLLLTSRDFDTRNFGQKKSRKHRSNLRRVLAWIAKKLKKFMIKLTLKFNSLKKVISDIAFVLLNIAIILLTLLGLCHLEFLG